MPRICTVFIFLSLLPMISYAANIKKYEIGESTYIVVRKDFVFTGIGMQDSVAKEKNEKKEIDCSTDKSNFDVRKFKIGSHVLINMDEDELELDINLGKIGLVHGSFRPAVIYDIDSLGKFFGLVDVKDISHFAEDKGYSETSAKDILNYQIHDKATVIYAICPPDRKGFCKIKMKTNGKWCNLELNGVAQSRLGYDLDRSIRLKPDSDTPQGIYSVSAIMYNSPKGHPVFGILPRIDVDGSSCDIVIAPLPSDTDSLVPERARNSYKLNEWPLACALGRYAMRLHADPTSDFVADTSKLRRGEKYYYDQKNKTYYRTSGCINLGNEGLLQLIKEMESLQLIDDKKKCDKDNNYIMKIRESERVFLIVLDNE